MHLTGQLRVKIVASASTSCSKEPERPTEALKGDGAVGDESAEHTVSLEKLKKIHKNGGKLQSRATNMSQRSNRYGPEHSHCQGMGQPLLRLRLLTLLWGEELWGEGEYGAAHR